MNHFSYLSSDNPLILPTILAFLLYPGLKLKLTISLGRVQTRNGWIHIKNMRSSIYFLYIELPLVFQLLFPVTPATLKSSAHKSFHLTFSLTPSRVQKYFLTSIQSSILIMCSNSLKC